MLQATEPFEVHAIRRKGVALRGLDHFEERAQ
jgi:hypothetical protein